VDFSNDIAVAMVSFFVSFWFLLLLSSVFSFKVNCEVILREAAPDVSFGSHQYKFIDA